MKLWRWRAEEFMDLYDGSGNYFIGNLIWNYGAMYAFGGTILTLVQILPLFVWFSLFGEPGDPDTLAIFIERAIMTFVPSENFLFMELVVNPLVGTVASTLLWSKGMSDYHG
jgi:hypothetical protein